MCRVCYVCIFNVTTENREKLFGAYKTYKKTDSHRVNKSKL